MPKINKRVIIVKELQNERNFVSVAKILVSKLRVLYDQQVALCVLMRLQVVPTVLLVIN